MAAPSPTPTPTLTLLHGFAQSGESWSEVAGLLPPGCEVLAPDLRPASIEAAGDQVLRLWDEQGVERSHLAGYSMGGRLALHLAVRAPERLLSLAVIGAHAGLEVEARGRRRAEDEALAARIEAEGVDWFADQWPAQPLFAGLARRGPEFLAELDRRRRRLRAADLAAWLRELGAGAVEPFWDRLPAIRASTLVIVGAEDEAYRERGRRLASLIPRARLELVPEAGHAAHLEQPAAVARLLAAHLSDR